MALQRMCVWSLNVWSLNPTRVLQVASTNVCVVTECVVTESYTDQLQCLMVDHLISTFFQVLFFVRMDLP